MDADGDRPGRAARKAAPAGLCPAQVAIGRAAAVRRERLVELAPAVLERLEGRSRDGQRRSGNRSLGLREEPDLSEEGALDAAEADQGWRAPIERGPIELQAEDGVVLTRAERPLDPRNQEPERALTGRQGEGRVRGPSGPAQRRRVAPPRHQPAHAGCSSILLRREMVRRGLSDPRFVTTARAS